MTEQVPRTYIPLTADETEAVLASVQDLTDPQEKLKALCSSTKGRRYLAEGMSRAYTEARRDFAERRDRERQGRE